MEFVKMTFGTIQAVGFLRVLRDATQSPRKPTIFSPLKIGGGRGVNPDFGKIETKDSNCCDRTSVRWENLD